MPDAGTPPSSDPSAAGEGELLTPGLIHEMRHPLTGIQAGLGLLAEALGPALTGREEWEIVRSQLTRLEEIFRSYQQFLSPEGARISVFEVLPVVERAAVLLAFRSRRLGSRFSIVGAKGCVAARGSPQALLHAVTNLVANALDAVAGREDAARVEIRVQPALAPGRIEVRVADDGPGVPPELRARIFDARFTTKGAGGTGLGLSLARRMIEACGGEVRLVAEDAPGRAAWARTEFAVELPEGGCP